MQLVRSKLHHYKEREDGEITKAKKNGAPNRVPEPLGGTSHWPAPSSQLTHICYSGKPTMFAGWPLLPQCATRKRTFTP